MAEESDIPWARLATSKPFRFTVGTQKREFTIHSGILSCLSPALERLVNGNFKEAQDGHAVLEHVDEDTFARFTQYAYTEAYDGPCDATFIDRFLEFSREYRSSPLAEGSSNLTVTNKDRLWNSFASQFVDMMDACLRSIRSDRHQDPKALLGKPDYTEGFLCHARIYVLADYYGISDLMDLSFARLGQALAGFELNVRRAGHIVALLRYCYETPAPEKLKGVVVLYAACKASVLWKNKGFQDLMAENRELMLAFIGQVMKTVG